jgi:hypothetical protein
MHISHYVELNLDKLRNVNDSYPSSIDLISFKEFVSKSAVTIKLVQVEEQN